MKKMWTVLGRSTLNYWIGEMRLLGERFRQNKERTGSQSKLRKFIDDVRGKHGVLLKSKRIRSDDITVYFSWSNYTPKRKNNSHKSKLIVVVE